MEFDAPDYQHVLWNDKGSPYWATASGKKIFITPAVAMSMWNEPEVLNWAKSKGFYIEGGLQGLEDSSTPNVDETGHVTFKPSPIHGSAPSGGLFHETGTWNGEEGNWDQGLDWGNILTLVVAGGLTAGAAVAMMGGGVAANAAVSAAVNTGSVDAGLSAAGTGTGFGAGIGTGAGSGLGVGLGEVGATTGLASGVGLPGAIAAPAIGGAAGIGPLAGGLAGATTEASVPSALAFTPLESTSLAGTGMLPAGIESPGVGSLTPLAQNSSRTGLMSSLTSPNMLATLASGGLGLVGQILANNSNNANAEAQNTLTRQISALNATQMNPVSQNMDLAHASGIASALAHGPVTLGSPKPFDTSQSQAFLGPDALKYSTGRFNDMVNQIGTTPQGSPGVPDLTKMGFPPSNAPTPVQPPASLPTVPVPQDFSAAPPQASADPRRNNFMSGIAGGQPTDPSTPASPNDYFTRRRKPSYQTNGGLV